MITRTVHGTLSRRRDETVVFTPLPITSNTAGPKELGHRSGRIYRKTLSVDNDGIPSADRSSLP
ncbi:heme A synthase [Anopheles sinensis]|uniref:Heme A synthase n=1 Tax=Anopheles sinensis TaxID=74873 RepID=A0A084W517_ANOSI|nr:heme A synthase [Anopheles sinensis]